MSNQTRGKLIHIKYYLGEIMRQGFKEVANLKTNLEKFKDSSIEENFNKIDWSSVSKETKDEIIREARLIKQQRELTDFFEFFNEGIKCENDRLKGLISDWDMLDKFSEEQQKKLFDLTWL